ncbi:DapH/DapD/GlmU-related protein [Pseudoalteromonas sp. A601]|uniref:DapH/DapD/GlmU-related protein n=1 Tax=Pseudoalteromonas sp. A601 TaxID=1967839 RepID=UPI0026BBBAB9|nr:DapH/DapD/GlmU-related protein [Pseudoalteromonas sp. A601]
MNNLIIAFVIKLLNSLPRGSYFNLLRRHILNLFFFKRNSRFSISNGLIVRPYTGIKNLQIGDGVFINHGFSFGCPEAKIVIGGCTKIGPSCLIETVNHPYLQEKNKHVATSKDVTIGGGVWIGARVTILPGVSIGNNSVIAAGSVVTKDIPSNVLAGGVPARVIKKYEKNIDFL